jgi:hypothetical protein
VSLKMWSALRRRPLFDSQSRGGAAAQPLSGVAMPDQTRWTGRTNVKRAASIAPCLRRPPALSLLHFVLPRGPTLPHPTPLAKAQEKPGWQHFASLARARVRSPALPLGTHQAALHNGSSTWVLHGRHRVLVRQSASPRLGAASRFRYSELVFSSSRSSFPAGSTSLCTLGGKPFAPIARLGALDDYHPSTGSSALVPQDGPHYLGWYMLCLPSYFYGSCHRMPRLCPTQRRVAQKPA